MTAAEELARARQRLDLSIDELSRRTKIGPDLLRAIETLDADNLPPPLHLKGFLRACARDLGLDPDELSGRYLAQLEGRRLPVRPAAEAAGSPISRPIWTNVPEPRLEPALSRPVPAPRPETRPADRAAEVAFAPSPAADPLPRTPPPVPVQPARAVSPPPSPVPPPESRRVERVERSRISDIPLVRTPPSVGDDEAPDLRVFSSLPAPVSGGTSTRIRRSVSFALLVLVALLGSMGAGYWIVGTWQGRAENAAAAAPTEPSRSAEDPAASRTAAGGRESSGGTAGASTAASVGDLSGSWMLTNHVEQSDMSSYKGLTLGFRLELDQNGNRVRGEGMKWLENGRAVAPAARTPISIDGTIEGGSLALTFTERGARRTSRGRVEMQLAADGSLQGRFSSDAARSSGRAEAVRVSSPPAP